MGITLRTIRALMFVSVGILLPILSATDLAAGPASASGKNRTKPKLEFAPQAPTKLETLVIPTIHLDEVTLVQAFTFLSKECERLDSGGVGIEFALTPRAAASAEKLSLARKDIPAIEALKFITALSKTSYKVREDGLVVIDVPVKRPESTQDKVDSMFWDAERQFSFETLYGSSSAAETLKNPERIEVYRITPFVTSEQRPKKKSIRGHIVLSGPVLPTKESRSELIELFTAKETFTGRPACGREPGVLLRASSGETTVDVLFCFKCRDAVITRNDKRLTSRQPELDDIHVGMETASARKFLTLFQGLFPKDLELKKVSLD